MQLRVVHIIIGVLVPVITYHSEQAGPRLDHCFNYLGLRVRMQNSHPILWLKCLTELGRSRLPNSQEFYNRQPF